MRSRGGNAAGFGTHAFVCLFVCLFVCVQVGDKPLSADDVWKSVQEDIALAASKDLQARRVLTVPT